MNAEFVASEEAILDAARKATGLDEFGEGRWREHFRALLRAYDEESRLTEAGRQMVLGEIGEVLAARLACEAAWKRDPSRAAPRDPPPALHPRACRARARPRCTSCSAQDPANQVLEYWLAAAPRPRPPRATWQREPALPGGASDVASSIYQTDPGSEGDPPG